MAVIKTMFQPKKENPVLVELKEMDRKRDLKAIEQYRKKYKKITP